MIIKQFKYSRDNFGYLVYSGSSGIAIDAGAPDDIDRFARDNGINIEVVTNTHSHPDHTPGNSRMLELSGATFVDCRKIISDQRIHVGSEDLNIIYTPGHTMDCITFTTDEFMVTGDTLFNGTVGNCFSGELEIFFESLKRLSMLPGHMQIYAGHDYVSDSMTMARLIDPKNQFIDTYLKKYNPGLVVSALDDEFKVNPYVRFNDPAMINLLEERNMPTHTEFKRFESIMELY